MRGYVIGAELDLDGPGLYSVTRARELKVARISPSSPFAANEHLEWASSNARLLSQV